MHTYRVHAPQEITNFVDPHAVMDLQCDISYSCFKGSIHIERVSLQLSYPQGVTHKSGYQTHSIFTRKLCRKVTRSMWMDPNTEYWQWHQVWLFTKFQILCEDPLVPSCYDSPTLCACDCDVDKNGLVSVVLFTLSAANTKEKIMSLSVAIAIAQCE